jgi:Fic family protein
MSSQIDIPSPDWNSDLVRLILDLEKLRARIRHSEVPPYIFFQLKEIFQILETLGSARIEGNNTTLTEYVERIIEKRQAQDESRQELENLESGIIFIERNTKEETKIDRAYISELHKIVVRDLTPPPAGEGSRNPGELRRTDIKIKGANHVPPSVAVLRDYFDDFIRFINHPWPANNQLLMAAIAHHRFMHIHPFDNGNGRIGRLLNYALLIKLGFNVRTGRIINPSSVFYTNRDQYYEMLGKADSLTREDLLSWVEYFLLGLKNQIEKIDSLMHRDYTRDKILLPSLRVALDRQHVTQQEHDILSFLIKSDEMAIKATELDKLGIKGSNKKSYVIRRLRNEGMVQPTVKGGRTYTIKFVNSHLLRSVVNTLKENGFVADFLNQNITKRP